MAVAADDFVELRDVVTTTALTRPLGHEGKVKSLAFSPDGSWLASGSNDNKVRLWDMAKYRPSPP
jgi:WD40 repeat protein